MQTQNKSKATAKASRKVRTEKVEAIEASAAQTTESPFKGLPDSIYEDNKPLGDLFRKGTPDMAVLADNVEGLTYYQKAKRVLLAAFSKELADESMGY